MKATHIIGKHLNPIQGDTIKKCCMCGAENLQGLPRKQVLSSSFMDWDYIQDDDGVCVYCAACFGIGQKRSEYLRYTNFLATPSRLLRFKRDGIWGHLIEPLAEEPFVFGVTYSYKKHISFKAPINQPNAWSMLIQTENNRVSFIPKKTGDLMQILQNWYTICRDTTQGPTYFTKADILTGCTKYKKIETYGTDDYLREDAVIAPYRRTALLELLVYALNKGELKIKKTQKAKGEHKNDQIKLQF